MSHYIVLVKQVPDVTQITDNAFDPETGNLMRGKLPSVINELDAQALAFADQMRKIEDNPDSKIIALTMGPPMAEDVLRYSIARGADMGILLTDRVLGGADTVATANPLAFAVRKIAADVLDGSDDYVVISGMQSVDGDTAQVPAQMAEELSLPCVSYATDVAINNDRFEFTRIISGGSQVVTPKTLPAVITVAKYEYPLFATFAGTRRANKSEIIRWTADDVKPTAVGVKGSKTRVIRVFPPPKTSRKCLEISSTEEFAQAIIESYKSVADSDNGNATEAAHYLLPSRRDDAFNRQYEGTDKECKSFDGLTSILKELEITDVASIDDATKERIIAKSNGSLNERTLKTMLAGLSVTTPKYNGEVWVVAEHDGQECTAATYELIGKANDLAKSLETKVGVLIAGDSVQGMADGLIAGGADKIYAIEHPLLRDFDPVAFRKTMSDVIGQYWPQIVLFAATPQGRTLAPMISYRLGCGLTADCTSLEIRDNSKKEEVAVLMQTRPALGGNVMATICTKDSRCQMATARPGVMTRLPIDTSRTGEVIACNVEMTEADTSITIISTEKGSGDVNFDADVIIAGGRGIQGKDNYDSILSNLTTAIEARLEVGVERGASRAAVEQGYIERVHQVGQTGTAVGPKLYMALGISGAIQHMIGVANSGTIFAVNNDPNASIFKQCDYYIIGNVEEIVPQLVQTLGAK